MDLTKVLSISGKQGLFKVLGQTQNNGIIVESLMDGKRFPAYAAHKISSLQDISIYTQEDDVPLKDVFEIMYKKHEGAAAIDQNSDAQTIRTYFKEILPDFDEERVYNSDIKKVIRWYNDLHAAGMMKELIEAVNEEKEAEAEEKPKAKKAAPKKDPKKAQPKAQKATKQAPKATPLRTSSKKS